MDDYWLSKAAQVEAELDTLRVEYDEMKRIYNKRIEELERQLLESNLHATTRGINSADIQ
mgnify:CR=1 FL=1